MRREPVRTLEQPERRAVRAAPGGAQGGEQVRLGMSRVQLQRREQQLLPLPETPLHEGKPTEPVHGIRVLRMDGEGAAEGTARRRVVRMLQVHRAQGQLRLGRARACARSGARDRV